MTILHGQQAVPLPSSSGQTKARRYSSEDARDWLAPFIAVAERVPGNRRKTFAPHGGLLFGPDRPRVNAYTGIKARDINAVVTCIVSRDDNAEPTFLLIHTRDRKDPRFEPNTIAQARSWARCEVGLGQLADLMPAWLDLATKAEHGGTP